MQHATNVSHRGRASKVAADSLAILAVPLAALFGFGPALPRHHGGPIHVSPRGSDWHTGRSAHRPLATIQRAADLARPGDVVLIDAGVYRERVRVRRSGSSSEPITFRAQAPGTVTVSGQADAQVTDVLEWRTEGGSVFSSKPPWTLHRVHVDGEELFPFGSLATLRGFTTRPGALAARCTGDDGRLYLYLPNVSSPPEADLTTHRPVPDCLANGVWRTASIWVEASHIRIEGLRCELGLGCGIRIWEGSDIVVSECLFSGTEVGVLGGPCRGLRVEHCAYHNYPQAEWRRRWMSKPEVYAWASKASLLSCRGDGTVVRGNLVVHGSDGLQVTTADDSVDAGIDVSGNLIAYCTDDAIEFDGFAREVHFHGNLVYDCHESLGTSPVLAGPTVIDHNLFLHPCNGINSAQVKLMSPWLHMGSPLSGPIRNVEIRHNIFVGNWLCWYDAAAPLEDVNVFRNIFAIQRKADPPWHPGVTHRNNVSIQMPIADYPNPGRDRRWLCNAREQSDERGRSNSDAAPQHCGATPPGVPWTMKRPGPSWLDWRSMPATASLLDDLDTSLLFE